MIKTNLTPYSYTRYYSGNYFDGINDYSYSVITTETFDLCPEYPLQVDWTDGNIPYGHERIEAKIIQDFNNKKDQERKQIEDNYRREVLGEEDEPKD
jgi:hypothetical protein